MRVSVSGAAGFTAVSFADCSKAERELGWRARCGLAEICRDAWHWETKHRG